MTTINKRIQKIIDDLFDGNTRGFATKTNNNYHTIRNVTGERQSTPASNVIENIANSIDHINTSWLLTGKGTMLLSEREDIIESNAEIISSVDLGSLKPRPYIDSVYGSLGVPNGFALAIKEDECEKISIPFIREYDFSIRGRGDSMINRNNPALSINDGDVVACKLWTSRSHIRWGSVYALSTTEGVIIKKVVESEKEGYIKCVSFNEEDGYTPYDLPLTEIYDWSIVIAVISICNWN